MYNHPPDSWGYLPGQFDYKNYSKAESMTTTALPYSTGRLTPRLNPAPEELFTEMSIADTLDVLINKTADMLDYCIQNMQGAGQSTICQTARDLYDDALTLADTARNAPDDSSAFMYAYEAIFTLAKALDELKGLIPTVTDPAELYAGARETLAHALTQLSDEAEQVMRFDPYRQRPGLAQRVWKSATGSMGEYSPALIILGLGALAAIFLLRRKK